MVYDGAGEGDGRGGRVGEVGGSGEMEEEVKKEGR